MLLKWNLAKLSAKPAKSNAFSENLLKNGEINAKVSEINAEIGEIIAKIREINAQIREINQEVREIPINTHLTNRTSM